MRSEFDGIQQRRTKTSVLPLLLLAGLAGPVLADQDVMSSDGQWKLHARIADSLAVGGAAQAIVDVSPAAGGKNCPTVSSVVFEMPAHGHGGKIDPKVTGANGTSACQFHVTDLSPSMDGMWRLRLVLKDGGKTSNADFSIPAK
jgi:hypothetical protein